MHSYTRPVQYTFNLGARIRSLHTPATCKISINYNHYHCVSHVYIVSVLRLLNVDRWHLVRRWLKFRGSLFASILTPVSRKQLVDCRKSADVIIRSSQIRFRYIPCNPPNNKSPFRIICSLITYTAFSSSRVRPPSPLLAVIFPRPRENRRTQWPNSYDASELENIVPQYLCTFQRPVCGLVVTLEPARYHRNNTLLQHRRKIIKNVDCFGLLFISIFALICVACDLIRNVATYVRISSRSCDPIPENLIILSGAYCETCAELIRCRRSRICL